MIDKIWVFMIAFSVIFGIINGRISNVAAAITEGSDKAVTLVISLIGAICFWSGIMEVMKECGLSEKIACVIRPILRPIFGKSSDDPQAAQSLSANITANLLGLGNAATPSGLEAAARLNSLDGNGITPPHSLINLIILNTSSLQIIPTTVLALRSSLGASDPYQIIPHIWIASIASITAGLASSALMKRLYKR